MRAWLREHVLLTTILLTLASYALVFGVTLEVIPSGWLPQAPAVVTDTIPHVNAGISVLALIAIGTGVHAIRSGRVRRHRRAMLTALGLFGLFLALYLYNVALHGPQTFPGPDEIYTYVYLPVLIIHVGLAVLVLPPLYYVALLAGTRPVSAIPSTPHARVARPTAVFWAVSFVLGLVVYVQLYVLY